jgi:peptidoglycan/xylan/chitin deacetylase (PgdA/CDA1 family)
MIKTLKNNIYIVVYHYVREIKKSKNPNLKGLEFSDFKKQIKFFLQNFNILSNEKLVEIIKTKKIPRKKSIFLTFDDGYVDHWKYVYPYLKEKKITGNFYPPVCAIKNKKVLDVNKIHFILEKEQNRKKILNHIFKLIRKYTNKSEDDLNIDKINTVSRFDDKETTLIKRLLQTHLPLKIREKITNDIFKSILNYDEKDFAKKIYMNKNHLIEMNKNNMTIGSHGYNHFWWKNINYKDQLLEIKKSIEYFKKIRVFNENFSVCYPYGSYNLKTLKILKSFNVKFALTTKVNSLSKNNINKNFELPRFDTNNFKI